MYLKIDKGSKDALINLDTVAYIEPHKDIPTKSVVHYTNGLFVVLNLTVEELAKQIGVTK